MRRWFTLFPPQCFVSTWRWFILFPLLWKRRWFTLLPPQSLHGGDSHYSHPYEWGGDSHYFHLYEQGGDSYYFHLKVYMRCFTLLQPLGSDTHYFHLNVYVELIQIIPTSMNEEMIHIISTSMFCVYMEVINFIPTSMKEEVIHITSTSKSTWRWFTLLPPLWTRRWFT